MAQSSSFGKLFYYNNYYYDLEELLVETKIDGAYYLKEKNKKIHIPP